MPTASKTVATKAASWFAGSSIPASMRLSILTGMRACRVLGTVIGALHLGALLLGEPLLGAPAPAPAPLFASLTEAAFGGGRLPDRLIEVIASITADNSAGSGALT